MAKGKRYISPTLRRPYRRPRLERRRRLADTAEGGPSRLTGVAENNHVAP
ncbi:MAG TPA: hypothetical protein VNE39_29205 [Planctomycetota bacterium]|nr:hypothetical protein [Planctomycetota bacterium]